MTRGQVCLRRGEERKLLAGSNWIFDNQIDWVDQFCADGSVVEVLDSRQRPMGLGFFNGRSKIAVRMLTRDVNETVDGASRRRGRTGGCWALRTPAASCSASRTGFPA